MRTAARRNAGVYLDLRKRLDNYNLYPYPTSVEHFNRTVFGIFAQSADLL